MMKYKAKVIKPEVVIDDKYGTKTTINYSHDLAHLSAWAEKMAETYNAMVEIYVVQESLLMTKYPPSPAAAPAPKPNVHK